MNGRRSTHLAAPAVVVSSGAAHADTGFTPIRIFDSDHCLDNATENSAKLQMWNRTYHAEQNWDPAFDQSTGDFSFVNLAVRHHGPLPEVALPTWGNTGLWLPAQLRIPGARALSRAPLSDAGSAPAQRRADRPAGGADGAGQPVEIVRRVRVRAFRREYGRTPAQVRREATGAAAPER